MEGIHTTIPLHLALCDDAQVAAADLHTGFLETWLAEHPLAATPLKVPA